MYAQKTVTNSTSYQKAVVLAPLFERRANLGQLLLALAGGLGLLQATLPG